MALQFRGLDQIAPRWGFRYPHQILEEKISTGFHNGCDQAQQKSQPAKHAPHHPTKSTASRAFSSRMELLPTTGGKDLKSDRLRR
jgi:hypothetical protein